MQEIEPLQKGRIGSKIRRKEKEIRSWQRIGKQKRNLRRPTSSGRFDATPWRRTCRALVSLNEMHPVSSSVAVGACYNNWWCNQEKDDFFVKN